MELATRSRTNGGMESLIPVVNKLRDVFQRAGSSTSTIQLPQIVVVGSQSSGKSSVLEGLVRKQFLPRGDGMVTRCPIVLMLIHTPGDKEWVEFDHRPGEKIADFGKVEEEIRKKTDELAGGTLFISPTQIKLKVYSPNVLTLTVVDLPGVVKIPVGDQPEDIEKQTVDLAKQYISQRNSIILAVSDGSVNIANSDSLKLAKEVDPTEERTIAVVTKADLAEGDDFKALITGQSVQLKLGLVGVINRSKHHIEKNMSFEDVQDEEESFFQREYPQVAKYHGTPYLAKRLNHILMQHIQKCCPSIDVQVKELLAKTETKLAALGTNDNLTDTEKLQILTNIIVKFAQNFSAQVDGQRWKEISTETITGNAKLTYTFWTNLPLSLKKLDPLKDITDHDILIATANAGQVVQHLFNPEEAANALIKQQVAKMKPVALYCTKLVHQIMSEMIKNCMDHSHRFPAANAAIMKVTLAMLDRMAKVAKSIVENYIDVQAMSAFTSNAIYKKEIATSMANLNPVGLGNLPVPVFLENTDDILKLSDGTQSSSEENPEALKNQTELFAKVRGLIKVYFEIVRDQVADHVPKALLHSLIYAASREIMEELVNELRSQDQADILIQEERKTAEQRQTLIQEIEDLKKAADILDDVRDAGFMD